MKESITLNKWVVSSLPFVWGPLDLPVNGLGLPDALPFCLGVEPDSGCVIQLHDESVKSALSKAYLEGSVLTSNMDDQGIGRNYADDFITFIEKVAPQAELTNLKVLEIGCGNGYLLKCLSEKGVDVLGIEPGNHGQVGAKKWGVPIVQDTFPSHSVDQKFDLVIAFGVLEHVENPVEFLSLIANNLSSTGTVIMAVPDAGPCIVSGDVSTLFHEHWSYFDQNTLFNTVKLAGYSNLKCELSGYGGSIYCAMKKNIINDELSSDEVQLAIIRANNFIDQARKHVKTLSNYIKDIQDKGETLAVYVPGRVINALSIADIAFDHIRFIDDNPVLLGTYFPGINIRIESRQELLASPTDNVIIMSRTFGSKLAAELKSEMKSQTNIVTIDHVLTETHDYD
jgi:SAM-dependent methyltransferase